LSEKPFMAILLCTSEKFKERLSHNEPSGTHLLFRWCDRSEHSVVASRRVDYHALPLFRQIIVFKNGKTHLQGETERSKTE
jgi:hypothetical protein